VENPAISKSQLKGVVAHALNRLLTWRPGGYLRASGGLFGWLLLRAAAQAAMVVLLARLLGAEGYGLFVTVMAVSCFFSPVAGLGLGGLLLRDGACAPAELPRQLGMALALWWPAVLVCSLAATVLLAWSLPSRVPLAALAAFALAEVGTASFVELAARVEQARHRVGAFGAIQAGLILARLIGLLLYAVAGQASTVGYLGIYALASAFYAFALARRLVAEHAPIWPAKRTWAMACESFPFMIGALSFRLQAEFNKPLLARASYGQAGNFNVAQRAVDLASLPLQALQEALWPRLYAGRHSVRQLWLVGAVLFAAALLEGGVLVLLAPWVARILGAGFEVAAHLVMLLALLPALQLVRNLLNAVVAQQRRQSVLTMIYLMSGVAGILFNLWLVPAAGLQGAVAASYLVEAVLLMLLGAVVLSRSKGTHGA